MPKVSVIVPVYGVEKYLRACVDSILTQSIRDIEVVLVNDGSPDNCPAIIDDYAANDSRVIAVHQENQGPGPARNAGMAAATGEFIAFMDPDDLYPSNETLEHLYTAAVSSGSNIAGGKLWLFKDGTDPATGWELPVHTNFPHYGIVDYKDFQSPFAYDCYIYKRSFLNEHAITFPELRRFEDPVFFVRAMTAAEHFVAIDERVYFYRVECRTVDWLGNGAQKLHEHLIGAKEVLKLANTHQLSRLAQIISGDVQGLLKHVKAPPRMLPRDITVPFLNEAAPILEKRHLRRLRRRFGIGFFGLIGRILHFVL